MSPSSESSFVDVEADAKVNGFSQRSHGESGLQEPIAIVGLGCRLPGGVSSVDDLWDMLIDGRTGQCDIPSSRFNAEAFYHPNEERPGSMNTKGGYFLMESIRDFENYFFGINNLEATYMDPQQRKLLEVVYECFESAGARLQDVSGSNTGVYVGNFTMDFQVMQTRDPEYLHRYSATGMGTTILSNRVSHVFNLQGPSLVLDTACSSSLYCLHTAVMALRSHECDAAVVAGVNLIQSPEQHIGTMKAGVLSKTSTCHTFSDQADGYGRADGVGAIYVKRLGDAIANGDPIRAIVRGSAVNANGRTPGITQPSSTGQEAVIRKAYAQAGLDPQGTSYVEAHGTGTPVGDPIEVRALANTFSKRSKSSPLLIGSVKPNLGHSEAASGISSIIKVVLAIERGIIPPTVNVGSLNPEIKAYEWNIEVVTQNTPWPCDGSNLSRRAGVNSFGYGGANVHVILEAADKFVPPGYHESVIPTKVLGLLEKKFLLPFSASSQSALTARISKLQSHNINLVDLTYTLTARRSKLAVSGFIIAEQHTLAKDFQPQNLVIPSVPKIDPERGYTFVFTGQGAQWAQMGKDLIEKRASFRASILRYDAILQNLKHAPSWTLIDTLTQPANKSRINEVARAQPACTAIQIALVDLLSNWGIKPSAVIGHSSGEIAAAYAAGLLSSAEAITIAYYRGYVVSKLSVNGQMMAVGLGEEAAKIEIERNALAGKVVVACVNSSESVTLSGDADGIDTFDSSMGPSMVFRRKLLTDGRAYHSHHMAEIGAEYESLLRSSCEPLEARDTSTAKVKWVSSVFLDSKTAPVDYAYWRHNLEKPVLFGPALEKLLTSHQTPIIELGPHGALKMPTKQTQDKVGITTPYFQALARGKNSEVSLLELMGNLYIAGVDVPLTIINGLDNVTGGKDLATIGKVSKNLPTYQWTYSQTLWNESRASIEFRNRQYARHELLGSLVPGGNLLDFTWRNIVNADDISWIQDHKLDSTIVFPAAGYIAMAIEALAQDLGKHQTDNMSYELRNVSIVNALSLSSQGSMITTELFTTLRRQKISAASKSTKHWEFQISSVRDESSTIHATGLIMIDTASDLLTPAVKLDEAACEPSAVRNWYQKMRKEGLNFGDQFQTMKRLSVPRNKKHRWAISEIDVRQRAPGGVEEDSSYIMHPISIDAMLQTAIIASAHGIIPDLLAQVPVAFESAIIRAPTASDLASSYVVYADSHATSFSTATVSTELRKPDGQVHAKINGMRLTTYQGSANNDDVTKRHPMLRVCWKPDLISLQTAPAALEAFLEREAAIEKSSAEACTTSHLYEMLAMVELVCHKNPRARILYLLTDIHDLTAVRVCMIKLGSNTEIHSYGSFAVGEITEDGVVSKKQLFDASSLLNLASLPVHHSGPNFDIVIVPEALKDLRRLDSLLPLLNRNGLLLTPSTSGWLSSALQSKVDQSDVCDTANICGIDLVQKSALNPKKVRIKSLILVENAIDDALGDAILTTTSHIAESIIRLPFDDVSTSSIPLKSTVVVTIESKKPFLSTMDEAQMKRMKVITDRAMNIVWATTSGMLYGEIPDMALIGGLSRSLMLEHPALSFYTLDIDSETPYELTAKHIVNILSQGISSSTIDYEFVERNNLLHISRFLPDYVSNKRFQQRQGKHSVEMTLREAGNCSLYVQGAGQDHSLCFKQELGRTELKDDFVEVEVMAHGVDARDSQELHGKAETKHSTCATEFTGIVTAVGSSVSALAPGDRVIVMAPNHFRFVEQVPAWACQKLEDGENFTALSTILMTYATAMYALYDRALVQSGETVLVHIDASGIGLAAARLATIVGAEAFCTVTTPGKRDLLVKSFGFDTSHVFILNDSSNLADIMTATNGRGVDVVLDSSSGDLLHDSWRACADFGRFVQTNSKSAANLDVNFSSKQLTYTTFELSSFFYSDDTKAWRKWSSLMQKVLELHRQGIIQTVGPLKIFDASDLSEAYRYVSKESSIGKAVISLENREAIIDVLPRKYATMLSRDKTYFLVGCLGGLGVSLSKWMVSRGARRLVFLGRSGTDRPAARRLVEDLQASGAEVSVFRGDVVNMADVQRAIDSIEGTLGGVVQAAMGLSESLFTTMTNSAWHTGIRPKLQGTWNIHNAIAACEEAHGLDFFLMTSSVSGSVGTATESNYCAANHFLDAFARYRRAHNKPAISLGLGMISEVGYLHENPEIELLLLRKGIQAIDEEELLQIVDIALSGPDSSPAFLRTDPLALGHILTGLEPLALKGLRSKGFDVSNPILSDPRASLLATAVDGIASGNKDGLGNTAAISSELTNAMEAAGENVPLRVVLDSLVAKRFCNLILMPAEKMDVKVPLSTYGMDSMLAAEFRAWVYRVFNVDVPFLDLLSHTTSLDSLVDGIEIEITSLLT